MASNAERQRRGEACVRHWKWCAGEVQTVLGEEDVVDLVTDALHYASIRSFDLNAILAMARVNQEAESADDESDEEPL
jgi:hypothetical protein